MAGLLMSALLPIITMWSLPWLSSKPLWITLQIIAVTCNWSGVSFIVCDTWWRCAQGGSRTPHFSVVVRSLRCSISTAAEQLLILSPLWLFLSSVPGHIRARFVLLLRGGRVLSAQSELWNHPQTGVSRPSDRGQLHEEIRQGDFHLPTLSLPECNQVLAVTVHFLLHFVSPLRQSATSCYLTLTSSQRTFQITSRRRKW